MCSYDELYEKWCLEGKLECSGNESWSEFLENNIEGLSGFLANKINCSENITQMLQVVSFANHLLSTYGWIVGKLQNFINAIINKLKVLAQTSGGVYFHIDVGTGFHISITFQVNPVQTKVV